MKINIKPLSVNKAWQGKRFKTKKYKAFETELLLKLPHKKYNYDKYHRSTLDALCQKNEL